MVLPEVMSIRHEGTAPVLPGILLVPIPIQPVQPGILLIQVPVLQIAIPILRIADLVLPHRHRIVWIHLLVESVVTHIRSRAPWAPPLRSFAISASSGDVGAGVTVALLSCRSCAISPASAAEVSRADRNVALPMIRNDFFTLSSFLVSVGLAPLLTPC